MSIINFLNPFKQKWWRRDEWVRVKNKGVYKIKEKHDCPSWDLEFYRIAKYKNKNSCEERMRIIDRMNLFDKTVFQKPEEIFLLEHYDIYGGDEYE